MEIPESTVTVRGSEVQNETQIQSATSFRLSQTNAQSCNPVAVSHLFNENVRGVVARGATRSFSFFSFIHSPLSDAGRIHHLSVYSFATQVSGMELWLVR